MQCAQQQRARARLRGHGLAHQAVDRVPVGQRRLEDLRGRCGQHPFGPCGGFFQHGMHLAPRGVVTNGDRGVQHITRALHGTRIVFGGAAQDGGVGDGDLFTQAGADAGGKHAHVGHRALLVGNAHIFTTAKHPAVGQDQATGRLPHQVGGTQRNHQPHQHRQALERLGLRTGQVGVGHGQGKQPHHGGGNAPCGHGHIGVQPCHAVLALLDAVKKTAQHAGGGTGQVEDHHCGKQARHRTHHGRADQAQQVQQIAVEGFAPDAGERKPRQHKTQPLVGQQEQHQAVHAAQQLAHHGGGTFALQQLNTAPLQLARMPL